MSDKAVGVAFELNPVSARHKPGGMILEKIHAIASSTTIYLYGAGVDTPTNALGTGSYQLSHIKTIDSVQVQQTTATAAASCAVISSEETVNDLMTITTGNGDECDIWVLGWAEES